MMATYLLNLVSSKLVKEMRYDLYYWFFKRCSQIEEPFELDAEETRMNFDMEELTVDIYILALYLSYFCPLRFKLTAMVLISSGFLFWECWQLTIVAIVGLCIYGLFQICLHSMNKRIQRGYMQVREKLQNIYRSSYQKDGGKFSENAAKFDDLNELLYGRAKSDAFKAGLLSGAAMLIAAVTICGSFFYEVHLHDEKDTNGNSMLDFETIARWSVFACILIKNCFSIVELRKDDLANKRTAAQARLYQAMMMDPITFSPLEESSEKFYDLKEHHLLKSDISQTVGEVPEMMSIRSETPRFLGSRVFVTEQSRTQLPVLLPLQDVNIWKIMQRVVGQDLMRISLPIELHEPVSGIQRMAEGLMYCHGQLSKAAK